jgi:O-antigen biosynthesis protein
MARRRRLTTALQLLRGGHWKESGGLFTRRNPSSDYAIWRALHAVTPKGRQEMVARISAWKSCPVLSVMLWCGGASGEEISRSAGSVRAQIYPNFELLVVGETHSNWAESDARVRFIGAGGSIPEGLNAALAMATGSYVVRLHAGDTLAAEALFRLAEILDAGQLPDLIYSDEDRFDAGGHLIDPFFKPDWSPEYFLSWNYLGGMVAIRKELIQNAGGWRAAFDGAADYDLILRCVGSEGQVRHLTEVLYHRKAGTAESGPEDAALRSVQDYLQTSGRGGTVEPGIAAGTRRVRYKIKGEPKVSIVIPTASRKFEIRGKNTWFLLECVESIRRLTTWRNLEIIAVDNNDMPAELEAALRPLDVRILRYTEPFNLARKMNFGAFAGTGEQLVLLNDDIEVITPDWIEAMLEFSQQPEIGAVGLQLLFPNNTLQHTGVIILNENPRHPFYGRPANHPGYFNSSQVHRNWSAVTGACLMTPASLYRDVGGFTERFPLNYNDVDYCLKVIARGKRVVYTPFAKLYHYESVSKSGTHEREAVAFKKAWGDKIQVDPFYSPHLENHFRIRIG